jgi:glutathione S-transferase
LIVGRQLRIDHPEAQRSGKYFAEKYGHSPYMEEQAKLTLRRVLLGLKQTLSGRQYLVGDAFTRADLTTAAMLMLLSPAPQEFFAFPDQVRRIYMDPLADDPAFSPVFAWRDEMYKKHRGEAVRP